MEDPSHKFLTKKQLVHSWFMGLNNLLKIVVHHFLIGRITGFGYQNEFPMMSALMCVYSNLIMN